MACADCDLTERCRCVRIREQKARGVTSATTAARSAANGRNAHASLPRTPNVALIFALLSTLRGPKDRAAV
jgi:hypothetical protein